MSSLLSSMLPSLLRCTRSLLLNRTGPLLSSSNCGMKWVANPKPICQHCYVEVIDETRFVFCSKHPSHRQGQRKANIFGEAILSGTSTAGTHIKGGLGRPRRQMLTQAAFRGNF